MLFLKGKDTIIVHNIRDYDNNTLPAEELITRFPEQVKLAIPTYDDSKVLIPLWDRFVWIKKILDLLKEIN